MTSTWNAADPSRVVNIIDTLAAQPWPITPAQLREVLMSLGWTSWEDGGRTMHTNLGVSPGMGSYSVAYETNVGSVDFAVTDGSPNDDQTVKADFLQNTFAAQADACREAWGEPFKIITRGGFPAMWWHLPGGAVARVIREPRNIAAEFITPYEFTQRKALGDYE